MGKPFNARDVCVCACVRSIMHSFIVFGYTAILKS